MDTKVMIKRTRVFQTLNHWRKSLLLPDYRQWDRKAREDFQRFCHHDGGLGLQQDLLPIGANPKTALIVRNISLPYAPVEAVMMKALQMAGFKTLVVGSRTYDFLRYDWLAGSETAFSMSDFGTQGDPDWVTPQIARLDGLHDWLNLQYNGVHVGRFVIASAMRNLLIGELNFRDSSIQASLRQKLEFSVRTTLAAARLLQEIKPDCVVFLDRGYSGQGEVFDLAISRGIDTLTWNMGNRSNRLVVKRYHAGNQRDHPLSLSDESWRRLCSIPWKPEYGRAIREELFQSYQTQDWFSVVGTQVDKKILSQQMTRHKLGISSDRKVAVVFPHILWDGSFFWGDDLFDNYTQWFVETIRAASANPKLEWVVKLHPAHIVKAKQVNNSGRPAELDVIENAFGNLPAHIRLVYPETELSTYALFEIADYVVTVRGTVGIESAIFGIPVITAGTGRYDRRGFTLDSSTPLEYLDKLATLEKHPRLSPRQIELAERYAFGVFICRPLNLLGVSLEFARDGKATPKVTVQCQTRQQWLASSDMRKLADWISDGTAEDMLTLSPYLQ